MKKFSFTLIALISVFSFVSCIESYGRDMFPVFLELSELAGNPAEKPEIIPPGDSGVVNKEPELKVSSFTVSTCGNEYKANVLDKSNKDSNRIIFNQIKYLPGADINFSVEENDYDLGLEVESSDFSVTKVNSKEFLILCNKTNSNAVTYEFTLNYSLLGKQVSSVKIELELVPSYDRANPNDIFSLMKLDYYADGNQKSVTKDNGISVNDNNIFVYVNEPEDIQSMKLNLNSYISGISLVQADYYDEYDGEYTTFSSKDNPSNNIVINFIDFCDDVTAKIKLTFTFNDGSKQVYNIEFTHGPYIVFELYVNHNNTEIPTVLIQKRLVNDDKNINFDDYIIEDYKDAELYITVDQSDISTTAVNMENRLFNVQKNGNTYILKNPSGHCDYNIIVNDKNFGSEDVVYTINVKLIKF